LEGVSEHTLDNELEDIPGNLYYCQRRYSMLQLAQCKKHQLKEKCELRVASTYDITAEVPLNQVKVLQQFQRRGDPHQAL